jgi:penicillin-binding protein 1C
MRWFGPFSRSPRRSRHLLRRLSLVAIGIPLIAVILFRAAVALLPYPAGIDAPPRSSTWIEDRNGAPLAQLVSTDQQWHYPLKTREFSPHLLHAIVAVEDSRFHDHHGVDWRSAAGAAWQDLSSFHLKRGASTITMQLHRLRSPAPRSFLNKLDQAIRAEQIEQKLTKQEVLLEYLNRAPFGGNLVGAEAASRRYFGVPCAALSLAQAALLAGLPQNPNHYRPDRYPSRAKLRRDHVLDRMAACGFISAAQLASARAEPVEAHWLPLSQKQPAAQAALPSLLMAAQRAPTWHIRTTIDSAIQRQTYAAAQEQLAVLAPSGIRAIAVVILDTSTAQCLACVSLSPDKPHLDLAACPRSTGSTLKPFIYAAAFESGIATPTSILADSPAAWPGYTPENYDRDYRGSLPASAALAQSRNIPALLLLAQLGVDHTQAILQSAGLATMAKRPKSYGLSLAIGGAEATPMELAAAYATLARGGFYRPATMLLDAPTADSRPAVAPIACWQTLRCLSESSRTASISPEAARINVAWKTGTSSGHRDAWCAAVTARRTVIVWMGNVSGEGSRSLVGAEAAAPLALRLTAALDPTPTHWPVDEPPASPPPTHLEPSLTLLSPPGNTEIIFNPDQPPQRQQIKLQATSNQPTLWWFIDNRLLDAADPATPAWWTPSPGVHELRVIDSAGHCAAATLRVR